MNGSATLERLRRLGPGLAIAATGVGAGDLIAASLGGLRHGTTLAWAVALGAVLKYALNEGVARWQLAEGQSVLSAVVHRFPRWVTWYLAIYFLVWTPAVAAALGAACGIAAQALWPVLGPTAWAILHSLLALGLVLAGGYSTFERAMKGLIATMFVCMVGSAIWVGPDWGQVSRGLLIPLIPPGSAGMVLSLMGGVGGSVTLLAYGFWIREKGWRGRDYLATARTDLGAAYFLTGLFGVAVLVVAASLRRAGGAPEGGTALLVGLGDILGGVLGPAGRLLFLVGVWAAIFTSMVGVWYGVPALMADFLEAWGDRAAGRPPRRPAGPEAGRSPLRTGLILAVAGLSVLLVPLGRPLWLIFTYTVIGSFFMPILAFALLRLNSVHGPLGRTLGYGKPGRALLWGALILFAFLGARELWLRL